MDESEDGAIEDDDVATGAPVRPVVVVHLMKTGGSSLFQQVMANVSREATWGASDLEAGVWTRLIGYTSVEPLRALDPEARSGIEAVMGHFPFAVLEIGGFARATTATILREPVERVISYLKMCRRSYPEHRDRPLEQIYEDEWLGPRTIRNHQTKMLGMTVTQALTPTPKVAGPPNPGIAAALVAEGYFDTAQWMMEVIDAPISRLVPVDGTTLERARRNLDQVDVVGVHADYDDFLTRLGQRTGWTFNRDIRANEGTRMPVTTSFRRRIEEDNDLDLELYEHARRLVRASRANRADR